MPTWALHILLKFCLWGYPHDHLTIQVNQKQHPFSSSWLVGWLLLCSYRWILLVLIKCFTVVRGEFFFKTNHIENDKDLHICYDRDWWLNIFDIQASIISCVKFVHFFALKSSIWSKILSVSEVNQPLGGPDDPIKSRLPLTPPEKVEKKMPTAS